MRTLELVSDEPYARYCPRREFLGAVMQFSADAAGGEGIQVERTCQTQWKSAAGRLHLKGL
jgi:hypothetical protein